MINYKKRFLDSFDNLDELEDLEEDLCRKCAETNDCFICDLNELDECIYKKVNERIFDLTH